MRTNWRALSLRTLLCIVAVVAAILGWYRHWLGTDSARVALDVVRSAIIESSSVRVRQVGYRQNAGEWSTLGISALRHELASSLTVGKGPWTSDGGPWAYTHELEVVIDGRDVRFQLLNGNWMKYSVKGREYIVKLANNRCEILLLEASAKLNQADTQLGK
jgi:hypothetical protein